MSVFKPFKAYRPSPEYAKEVASKPYDVLNSKEARIEAEGHEMSFPKMWIRILTKFILKEKQILMI
jgi:uncharacterized protein (DUF1015 family)